MKMEARNTTQRYTIFFVLNSVTLPPQHMENFSRPFEIMQRQEHKPFTGTICFLKAEDEQRSGRPSATRTGDNTARIREFVRSDRRLTFIIIADEVNMNREIVCLTLTEGLRMRKICAKMVPRNLTKPQRDARLSAVFYIQMHYGDAAAPLLTWSHTLRFFFFS
jgi:hypothetical protein